MKTIKKKDVEILLSGLKGLENQKLELEQYSTESGVAADFLWTVFMRGDLEGKVVGDFGCGNGVIGIGALLLGAKKVIFVDVDEDAIIIARENVKNVEKKLGVKFEKSFFKNDISVFNKKVGLVLQNPPFGVQKTHADKAFLIKAMKCGKKVYSFHKLETKRFVEKFAEDEGWNVRLVREYKFPLRKGGKAGRGYKFWKKKVHYVDVGVWEMEKAK